jgi:uncharacterized protein (DUF2126 family)
MADYVKVRLLGILPGISAAVRVLTAAAEAEGFEVAEVSRAYANRQDPGFRLYATLRFPAEGETPDDQRGAAHSRQAIRRPAAALPAKETQGKRHLP